MKFERQLELNANPDWIDYYINYGRLKKLTYKEEKVTSELRSTGSLEQGLESPGCPSKTLMTFQDAVEQELGHVVSFYQATESSLYERLDQLTRHCLEEKTRREIEADESNTPYIHPHWWEGGWTDAQVPMAEARKNDTLSAPSHTISGITEEDIHSDTYTIASARHMGQLRSGLSSPTVSMHGGASDDDELKDEARQLFMQLSELERYAQLNRSGFDKILKKHDKVMGSTLRKWFMNERVDMARPFQSDTQSTLRRKILRVEVLHGFAARIDNSRKNGTLLRRLLRDKITFSRNTVWRDMINRERMMSTVDVDSPEDIEEALERPHNRMRLFGRELPFPRIPRSFIIGVPCVIIFIVLLCLPIMNNSSERNCLALLVLASLFWAFEIVPLFVTSMLVPFLVVILGVMRDAEGNALPAPKATKTIFGAMFSPVIMLLLGGFAIAAAFSKYHIARKIAAVVLSKAGTRPEVVLISNMAVAAFLSMWISNVAAPVLCFSLLEPVLRSMPSTSNYGKSLVLGIALASNVGGMMSPISSPQNLISIDVQKPSPSWGSWFAVALPVAIISLFGVWALLMITYKPHREKDTVVTIRKYDEAFGWKQYFIIAVTLCTVVLWCIESQLKSYVGDMGVLAIIPLVVFFGSGLLTKEDFNNFLWTVIMLAMGGIALGQAVNSSGLLHTIATEISEAEKGFSLWAVTAVFALLMAVIATFISHTVAALVILPVVNVVGQSMPEPHARLMVMVCTMICSGAMGLPVSGFPNMTAIMLEDSMGRNYLKTIDFIKVGVPATLFTALVSVSLGYGILLALGF
ncbi:Sodium:sulfate symporter transmembrane region-domain-containing protein [Syncephalis fuscata]|nr:Sodium:sulfate symporter transmembrane region-domain-containing protein [Syncephalis fuscata]